MTVRVYVPSTTARLRQLVVSGGIGPAPLLAHAVTDALRASLQDGGEEEWEYAALTAAAQDSIGLLADDEAPRRVVVVAEGGAVVPVSGAQESLVEVDEVIPLRLVAAVHMDSVEAEASVAAARAAWPAAVEGDQVALDRLDDCLDHELGWFATQEIGGLVDG